MKRKIAIDELKIGMYVDLSGSWMKHDFLKNKFIISSNDQIAHLKSRKFSEVMIDPEKTIHTITDIDAVSHNAMEQSGQPATESALEVESEPGFPAKPRGRMSDELKEAIRDQSRTDEEKAKVVYQSSLEIMGDLFKSPTVENIKTTKSDIFGIVDLILSEDQTADHLLQLTSHDFYTYTHSVNVGVLAVMLVKALYRNSNAHDMHELGAGFFLHDVGKTKVDAGIINKPAKLTEKEMATMRIHPYQGYKLLKQADQLSEECAIIVMQHHERHDGNGYPRGIEGDEIHEYGKIGCIADVYDALTARRSYKPAMKPFDALNLMKNQMIRHFDTRIFENFVRLF